MKQKMIMYSVAVAATILVITACNKKETETTPMENPEVILPTSDSLVATDSANLGYDSATVKTAAGVKDEELNAVKNEKSDAVKLKKDEGKMK